MRGRLNYYRAILIQSVQLSYSNLKLDKFRTILSLSGVSVGLFIIVVILSLLNSIKRGVYDELSKHQGDEFYIQKQPLFSSPEDIGEFKWSEYLKREEVSFQEYEYLRDNSKMASSISFVAQKSSPISRGEGLKRSADDEMNDLRRGITANLVGVAGEWDDAIILNLERGRSFTLAEVENGAKLAIIGHSLSQMLFKNKSPIGEELMVGNIKVVVIGVASRRGESIVSMVQIDNSLIIPVKLFQQIHSLRGSTNYISVSGFDKSDDDESKDLCKELIRRELRQFRGLSRQELDNFSINELSAILSQLNMVMDFFGNIWWIIAAISLLIGGFGVANIMFVTVKERGAEIGLLRALGANERDILVQFLIEALILTLFGAFAGIILAFLLIQILSTATNTLELSLSTVGVVFIISTLLGLFSGVIPAIIASKESPIEAIRRF